jgi:deoxyribose-phosphate aldolase
MNVEEIIMVTVRDIAKMIDHSILHPTITDDDLRKQCAIAIEYDVATACVKPYHTELAAKILKDSDVEVCAVIGFPHGNSTTGIKIAEAVQVIGDGAIEVDMVVNIGKVLQGDWGYINTEIRAVNDACRKNGAVLKVILETDFITNDEDKIKLCKICSEHRVGFVKTSTGYGFVKRDDGYYAYTGATEHDLRLLREHTSPEVGIKASGGVRTLDQILRCRELGVTRVGATATALIIEEARKRFKPLTY